MKLSIATTKKLTGIAGEEKAVKFLRRSGYIILERNYRTKFGEMDIIAKDKKKDTLCFIEVKTRKDPKMNGIFAIDEKKLKKLRRVAEAFLKKHGIIEYEKDIRFDVISIVEDRIELIKNISC
jgi:putative endonuclease